MLTPWTAADEAAYRALDDRRQRALDDTALLLPPLQRALTDLMPTAACKAWPAWPGTNSLAKALLEHMRAETQEQGGLG